MFCEFERNEIAETLEMCQMFLAEPYCVKKQLERIGNGGEKEIHEGILTLKFLKERLKEEGCLDSQLIDFWAGRIVEAKGDEVISQFLAFARTLKDGGREKRFSGINGWGFFWQQPNHTEV